MRRLKTSALIGLVLCLASLPRAAAALPSSFDWRFAGWHGGGAFPMMFPDPASQGVVYLLSDVNGVWRSSDRGATWVPRSKGLTNDSTVTLAVAPSNPNVLYLGTKAGIQRSDDGGANWIFLTGSLLFKRPDNYRSIAVDRANSARVYAGTKGGEIFFSSDAGATWTRLGAAALPFGTAVAVSALHLSRDGRYLYAGSGSGLIRWDFSAGSWQSVPLTVAKAWDIAEGPNGEVCVTNGQKVAWTATGASWQYSQSMTVGGGENYRLSVAAGASGAMKFLVAWRNGWSGGAAVSLDSGAVWADAERNLNHDTVSDPTRVWTRGFGWPLSAAFDPFNSSILYFSDFWGAWRSDDGGQSWNERVKGAPNVVGSDLVLAPDGTLFAGTMDNGLLRSVDGGDTWDALLPSATYNTTNYLGHVWRVLRIPGLGGRLLATSSPWDVNVAQVALSTDAGVTFQLIRSGLPTVSPAVNTLWGRGYPRALAGDPTNPLKVYLGIDGDDGGGLYVSNDGGYNWTRSPGQPGNLRIYNGLAVDPQEPFRLYWGGTNTNGGVYRSENYGVNWTRVFSSSLWVFDIAVDRDGRVYAAADSAGPALYVSTNKGANWSLLKKFPATSGSCEAIGIDPQNPARLAVSTVKWDDYAPGKIYLSEDYGATWADATGNLPEGSGAAAAVFSADGRWLYAARMAGSIWKLDLRPDANPPTAPSSLSVSLDGSTVNLSWTASTDDVGVTGYNVYRDGTAIATVTGTAYADTVPRPAVTYSYTVKAFDASGKVSAASNTATATVPDTTAPTAPGSLSFSLAPGPQVNLLWNASSDDVGVAGYRVYRNGAQASAPTSPGWSDASVALGSTYVYNVVAFDAAGNVSGSSGTVAAAVTDVTSPTKPAGLSAVPSGSKVNLSWSASSDDVGVIGYMVYRDGAETGITTSTDDVDVPPSTGVTYSYTVKAFDAANNYSDASDPASCATSDTEPPTPPANLAGTLQADGTVRLSWTASTDNVGVASYKIFRDQPSIGVTAASSFVDPSPVAGATHQYSVAAVDAASNQSEPSNVVAVQVPAPADPFDGVYDGARVETAPDSPAWTFGNQDFTIDFFQKISVLSSPRSGWVGQRQDGGNAWAFYMDADGAMIFRAAQNGALVTNLWPWNPPRDRFVHVALVRSGNSWTAYVDGKSIGSRNAGVNLKDLSGPLMVGKNAWDNASMFRGELKSLRVTKGLARWTSNFTPPEIGASEPPPPPDTQAPTVPAGLTGSYGASGVQLAWTASSDDVGVAGYLVYRDSASIASSTTTSYLDSAPVAGATHRYAVAAFDAASNASAPGAAVSVQIPAASANPFDGIYDGARVETAPDSDLYFFGSQDFTIDGHFKARVTPPVRGAWVGQRQDAANNWSFYEDGDGAVIFRFTQDGALKTLRWAWSPVNGRFYHVALVRTGNAFALYVDGKSLGSQSWGGTLKNFSAPLVVGKNAWDDTSYFDGEMRGLRVTKSALWTGEFTPPA